MTIINWWFTTMMLQWLVTCAWTALVTLWCLTGWLVIGVRSRNEKQKKKKPSPRMEMALLATYESLGSYRHLYTDLDQAAINHPWWNSSQKKIILGGICCRLIVGPTPYRNVGINGRAQNLACQWTPAAPSRYPMGRRTCPHSALLARPGQQTRQKPTLYCTRLS